MIFNYYLHAAQKLVRLFLQTHDNGTMMSFPAEEFAKMAEDHREGMLQTDHHNITKRNAVKDYKYLWYLGTVYYDIDARTAGDYLTIV